MFGVANDKITKNDVKQTSRELNEVTQGVNGKWDKLSTKLDSGVAIPELGLDAVAIPL